MTSSREPPELPRAIALETSSRRPSVALAWGGELRERWLDGARPHASDLMPALASLFEEVGANPGDIEALLVGLGPGSYTGLRVGIATALGLARGSGAKIRGVEVGRTIAHQELEVGEHATHVSDARRGYFYLSVHRRTEEGVETERAPLLVALEDLEANLWTEGPVFADAVASAALDGSDTRNRLRIDVVPSASALLQIGCIDLRDDGPTPPPVLQPLYLRPFESGGARVGP